MPTRTETYALTRPVPYLLVQESNTQLIDFPVRHGSTGALVTVSAATVSVNRPDGTVFSSGSASLLTSPPSYTVPSTASENTGKGWEVIYTATISGVEYPYRRNAILCEYVPPCPVSVLDLYDRVPELEGRIPQRQGSSGTDEGWQPQIDAAYYEFLRGLIAKAQPIHELQTATDYFDWIKLRACELAAKAIPADAGSGWSEERKQLWLEARDAKGKIALEYNSDKGERKPASPSYRMAPAGRPSW